MLKIRDHQETFSLSLYPFAQPYLFLKKMMVVKHINNINLAILAILKYTI